MHEWNALESLCLAQLTVNAWGMFGQNAGLSISKTEPRVFHIGGAYQVYIPQLHNTDLNRLAALYGAEKGR